MLTAIALALLAPPTAARAEANLASYFSDVDYPAEAIRAGEQGLVAFRLQVAADGAVTTCTVEKSSGSASLDAATCRIMSERARFTPARDANGQATTDSFTGRIRWRLPEQPSEGPPLQTALRANTNVWEVTAAGRLRSCRRELRFKLGEQINLPECNPLDPKFVAAAAAYLEARPEEILTIRLENRWLIDPVAPFRPTPAYLGQVLARAEGDYRLNPDQTKQTCVEGRFSALLDWRPAPCFRESFAEQIPADARTVRMEVQWVVSRGPDTQRPAVMPSFVLPDGQTAFPITIRPRGEKKTGVGPLGESPHRP